MLIFIWYFIRHCFICRHSDSTVSEDAWIKPSTFLKKNYIDTKAKCCHLKKLTCKGTLRLVFICLRRPPPLLGFVWGGLAILYALNLDRYRVLNLCRIWSPTGLNTPPPPSHTLSVYTLLRHAGGRGRYEPERRLEGQQFTKLGKKYQHDLLKLHSINSDTQCLHTCREVPLNVNFFRRRHFALVSVQSDTET